MYNQNVQLVNNNASGQIGNVPPEHQQRANMEAVPIRFRHQFHIRHQSKIDGQVYEGQFTSQKLTVKQSARLGVRKSQLNGGLYYDEERPGIGIDRDTDILNSMIAHLEIAIIQAPLWWNIDEVVEWDLISNVFKEVADFENNFFLRQGWNQTNGSSSSSSNSSGESEKSRDSGRVEKVGGGEVQDSLDP